MDDGISNYYKIYKMKTYDGEVMDMSSWKISRCVTLKNLVGDLEYADEIPLIYNEATKENMIILNEFLELHADDDQYYTMFTKNQEKELDAYTKTKVGPDVKLSDKEEAFLVAKADFKIDFDITKTLDEHKTISTINRESFSKIRDLFKLANHLEQHEFMWAIACFVASKIKKVVAPEPTDAEKNWMNRDYTEEEEKIVASIKDNHTDYIENLKKRKEVLVATLADLNDKTKNSDPLQSDIESTEKNIDILNHRIVRYEKQFEDDVDEMERLVRRQMRDPFAERFRRAFDLPDDLTPQDLLSFEEELDPPEKDKDSDDEMDEFEKEFEF